MCARVEGKGKAREESGNKEVGGSGRLACCMHQDVEVMSVARQFADDKPGLKYKVTRARQPRALLTHLSPLLHARRAMLRVLHAPGAPLAHVCACGTMRKN